MFDHENETALLMPCEAATRKVLPALRAATAILLVKEYGFTTYRTAKLLGLTPAAISNYLFKRRGAELVDIILNNEKYRRIVEEIAGRLLSGASPEEVTIYACMLCRELRLEIARKARSGEGRSSQNA